jgi:hypothetical protein
MIAGTMTVSPENVVIDGTAMRLSSICAKA